MHASTTRHLALPALALAAVLGLAACGNDSANDTASPGSSSSEHGGGHSADSNADSAKGNDADASFLADMVPHHSQAVEMSDIVLTTNPPAAVAAIAQKIKGAQAPEIEQMNAMLADLGQEAGAEHGEGHMGGHGGMMSDSDLAALTSATGTEASRLYLTAMVAHHRGAIEASDAQIANGQYEPAITLAKKIKAAQAAEISEMETLLSSL